MSKEIKSAKTKEPDKNEKVKKGIAYLREALSETTGVFFEPYGVEDIFEELDGAIGALSQTKDIKERKKLKEKISELTARAVSKMRYPWDNLSYWPVDKMDVSYHKKMRNSLLQEYGPETATELMLIDVIAASYYNFMRNGKLLNHHFMRDDENKKNKVFVSRDPFTMQAVEEAGKAADMAYKQFTDSIILLKKIRRKK